MNLEDGECDYHGESFNFRLCRLDWKRNNLLSSQGFSKNFILNINKLVSQIVQNLKPVCVWSNRKFTKGWKKRGWKNK